MLESNVRAHAAHRPGRYRGAAVFVQGEENRAHGTAARWADVVDGPFRAHDVPAGHFDLVRRPHVDALAALVRDALGTAR
ncbi:Non-ribosomal peptide synthetase [Actinosynnema pretiosum subsp. pretiosum]|nr:Non-ribosomal peptide synthetase [Actinosynnema pretiosum subsp. pretiosum]